MRRSGDCQVLVAGGGPAGLAAAIALAERQVDVLVVDAEHPAPALSRCEMLPAAAHVILVRLGLASIIDSSVALRGVISLWDNTVPIDHAAAMPGVSGFGWSIDRRSLNSALRKRADGLGVRVQGGRVQHIAGQPSNWQIEMAGGEIQRAAFLVDATGRPASIARRLGAKAMFGPDLVSVTFNVKQPVRHNLLAEATPSGWWYALPRGDSGGSLGFLTSEARSLHDADYLAEAAQELRLIPKPIAHEDITVSDSRVSRLFPIVAPGWIATGDAAAAFDPIASQGLFNALSGGFFAGNASADALLGDQEAIAAYAALTDRTAIRTHRLTPQQYISSPYNTPFWNRYSLGINSDFYRGDPAKLAV